MSDPLQPSPFMELFGFELTSSSGILVTGRLEATEGHHTPWGVVHGGVYATIIETTCSVGASLHVSQHAQHAVGLSNHTDFVRAHRTGLLEFRAFPIHQGRTGQLWQCDVTRADGKLVAQGRVRLQNVETSSFGG